jgi:HNH endonuclease
MEDSAGMATLRSEAFHRSAGRCECVLADPARKCKARVGWNDGHLHHILSRAHGGSDVLGNVAFMTRKCHKELTGVLHWSPPAIEDWAS